MTTDLSGLCCRCGSDYGSVRNDNWCDVCWDIRIKPPRRLIEQLEATSKALDEYVRMFGLILPTDKPRAQVTNPGDMDESCTCRPYISAAPVGVRLSRNILSDGRMVEGNGMRRFWRWLLRKPSLAERLSAYTLK